MQKGEKENATSIQGASPAGTLEASRVLKIKGEL